MVERLVLLTFESRRAGAMVYAPLPLFSHKKKCGMFES
jgi:hypothetical protein